MGQGILTITSVATVAATSDSTEIVLRLALRTVTPPSAGATVHSHSGERTSSAPAKASAFRP